VSKHFRDGVKVCTGGKLQGSVGMPEAMESDRLRKEKQTEED